MSLRTYLDQLEQRRELLHIRPPASPSFEIAGLLKQLEPRPLLFEQVTGSPFRVIGNLLCSKASFADYLGIPIEQIIPRIVQAIQSPCAYRRVSQAPCQEVTIEQPDLDGLPILRHCLEDGGPYISSGVVIARHPQHGQNMDFHRLMQISPTEMAVRVVKGRHFDAYLNEMGAVDVAVCIGCAPTVLVAAATSVALGVNEMEIANALQPLPVVKALTVDVDVPAETEFVLEGTVYRGRRHAEGPFVDLTETYDVVRQEPVFVVKTITHRRDAIWQALLPGALEHKLLMGMPREPTIFQAVNRVVKCLDVNVNPGGCSWLHAIVQIDKQAEDDGLKAIQAAFNGHRSCKHVFVVDKDINIYDPLDVEWAMATRFQGDVGLTIREKEQGSSLDPSSEPGTHLTTKLGFDLTHPLETQGKSFAKAVFPAVDVKKFLQGFDNQD